MKKRRIFKRGLAVIVSSAMLAGIIPLSTTAETSAEKAEDANLSTSSQPTIICEDTSKREENVKQFYMSDGSYTAIMYSEPVHYQDTDGQFQNIDNTLELKTVSKSQKYYSNKANALHVQLPAISTDLVKATVKDHTLSWSLQNQKLRLPVYLLRMFPPLQAPTKTLALKKRLLRIYRRRLLQKITHLKSPMPKSWRMFICNTMCRGLG